MKGKSNDRFLVEAEWDRTDIVVLFDGKKKEYEVKKIVDDVVVIWK